MKLDSIAFALAGMVFGLLAGWVIGGLGAGRRPRTSTRRPWVMAIQMSWESKKVAFAERRPRVAVTVYAPGR